MFFHLQTLLDQMLSDQQRLLGNLAFFRKFKARLPVEMVPLGQPAKSSTCYLKCLVKKVEYNVARIHQANGNAPLNPVELCPSNYGTQAESLISQSDPAMFVIGEFKYREQLLKVSRNRIKSFSYMRMIIDSVTSILVSQIS